jgi:CheY-like chemotaxis protein
VTVDDRAKGGREKESSVAFPGRHRANDIREGRGIREHRRTSEGPAERAPVESQWRGRRKAVTLAGGIMSGARVIVADDDVLLREGVSSLLERADFEVLAQAGDASELIELVRGHEPELVLVDIRMPPSYSTEGLDAARVIREEFPEMGILVLSAYAEVADAMELLAGGRRVGYLLKSRIIDVGEFIETVERIRSQR